MLYHIGEIAPYFMSDFSLLLYQIEHKEYFSFTNPKMKEILKKKFAKFPDKKETACYVNK
jgi:hypothetical protein